jgi:cephalosporin-C deacetylase-like acetyl esterase
MVLVPLFTIDTIALRISSVGGALMVAVMASNPKATARALVFPYLSMVTIVLLRFIDIFNYVL